MMLITRSATEANLPGMWRLGMAQISDATRSYVTAFASILLIGSMGRRAKAESPQQVVEEAVQTELQAAKSDHTKWIYYETDIKPGHTIKQWVAETSKGSLTRVVEENGRATSEQQQRSRIESFIHDTAAQERQRRAGQQDDRESAKMMNLLPHAFIWTVTSSQGENITLHYKPNPKFSAPDYESRVFAVMEGDLVVNKAEHRIVSIKGRMMSGVKFLGGLLGGLDPGGTFNVERRQTGNGEWQITGTHVHIHGRILFFKNISEQEDDEKTKFRQLPTNISFQDAEKELMEQH
jgi:hypothetical protein